MPKPGRASTFFVLKCGKGSGSLVNMKTVMELVRNSEETLSTQNLY